MGSGISRSRAGPSRHRTRPQHRRRPTLRRAISSLLVCGSPSASRQMEDFSPEILVSSAENSHQGKLKFPRKYSSLPIGCRDDLNSSKSERCLAANENPSVEAGANNIESDNNNKGKCLSESRELVPSHEPIHNSRGNETASTSSSVDQPSPYHVDMSRKDSKRGNNSSQIGDGVNNKSHDEAASLENNVSEEVDFSNSDFSNSCVSDSAGDFQLPRDDNSQGITPSSALGFLVSEREPSRQDSGNLLHVDVVSISPTPNNNNLPSNSAEISSREARRNSRRLFWDAFSRRNSRRQYSDSRNFIFSPGDSDLLRPHDRWLLDFSGGLLNDEIGGDYRSNGSRTPGSNEQRWNSRSEIWERLRGGLDSTEHPTSACPRGIHSDGSCSCHSSSSTEESGARAGISRIVMLAEALFEVLDQIHQQPMSLSLSMVSVPAPESVVDSFPVKTHKKTERSESEDEVSQCYICLSEYEEGDKIRVLPCQHEYHMSCVDKWLKEIHGVCPLCRGDVREGFTEGSTSN